MLKFMVLFCLSAGFCHAECIRYTPSSIMEFDGPGSFGKLQDTVTLDCLKYVGSIGRRGIEQVLIKDETGHVHRMKIGDYMGENTGVITKIDQNAIYIRQIIQRNDKYEEVLVKFSKNSSKQQ